jgi:carboxypeptidase D
MDGVFLENGPMRFQNGKLVLNNESWHQETNMLYIDQPANTGYSVGPTRKTIEEVVYDFLLFLDHFYNTFPELATLDLYLSGESFAGVWISYISLAILKRNEARTARHIQLKSLLLGNAWLDPLYQYPAYLEFATEKHLINGTYLSRAEDQMSHCHNELGKQPRNINYDVCEGVMRTILDASISAGQYCINKYDYRLRDQGPNEGCGMSWPPGVTELHQYLSVGLE